MSVAQSSTSSTARTVKGANPAAVASRRRKLLGSPDTEAVVKGSPTDAMDLIAAMSAAEELVRVDQDEAPSGSEVDDPDDGAEISDGPEDEDEIPLSMLSSDDIGFEDDSVRELVTFEERDDCEPTPETMFTIAFSTEGARFVPPRWIANARGVPTSSEAQVRMFSHARRLRFLSVWAAWLAKHRPRFVATFALRYWAPASVEEVEAQYTTTGPNCLQKSMVQLLRHADPSLRMSPSTMSRYLCNTILAHADGYTMSLAELFSPRAQAIWAAATVICFLKEHKLRESALRTAAEHLGRDMIRRSAARVGKDPRAMRLQDFILFVQKPLSRTVSVGEILAEAKNLLAEEP